MIDLILDKGLVIDAFVRVSLVGIQVATIDARVVAAGVDTYLRFAEATNRLDLELKGGKDIAQLTEGTSQSGDDTSKRMTDAKPRTADDGEKREKQAAHRREPRGESDSRRRER
ncbi:gas vesicle protein GvpJ [Saccharopolyspora phatthalungensis]|uniref:Gas vesicle structural protein n=1 Tax=Saccharopolyspora phatthalungensis TaxID=664693 RepID=A0A840QE07_9PSEU|nr:gas vesicle protein GvpJ [Saccharopolyspora phatthalungensis]MBB5156898.1 hypothetical protein [Saccharopolyspora phatthalungensis]